MKTVTKLFTLLLITFTGTLMAQDTVSRPKSSQQPAPVVKTPAPANNHSEQNPVINKIAVSDPGMPPEKPANSTKRASSGKSTEKKKKQNSAVTPK
jgi:hypothetical protein